MASLVRQEAAYFIKKVNTIFISHKLYEKYIRLRERREKNMRYVGKHTNACM